ncbi:unnamed protein product [Kuraishia capsulata CBS 1993]|uniref:GPI inositol-deacylase n=1 Tax=Kuraishia capsulata CBS 1993 TaxID=1382522 RepID=W6MR92_9ASCO|nr:uncharacterized protein KUCA_T00003751001 [Kuraishia capsulata CBS 1993]CDK27772.1 unnamed protein product [Kuraishia capsulata CBS 1993]
MLKLKPLPYTGSRTVVPRKSQNQAKITLRGLTLFGLLLIFIITYSFSQVSKGADRSECRRVFMAPAYARIHGFDETHTRFASKYSLFLYREQGKDRMPPESEDTQIELTGTPVLFIPGNAGSFKQVRSFAAEAANIFYDTYQTHKDTEDHLNPLATNLDFFSADFNEDFTAFHGRTMLDQAEYLNEAIKFILTLYRESDNPVDSVILLGHSMGGIVARVMLSLPNYKENSINTIITLAAPHAAAPATFDGDILKVFASTDNFWRSGFATGDAQTDLEKIATKRLGDVSIVSITGGLSDNILPADYTTLDGLVPSTHGLVVSTTGIPGVWTPIDHLAVVWCDQLRKVVSKMLLEIVDGGSPKRTRPLPERMSIFKRHLLSGFEEISREELEAVNVGSGGKSFQYQVKIDTKHLSSSVSREKSLQIPQKKKAEGEMPELHLFYIPKDELKFKYTFLSSLKPVAIEQLGQTSAPAVLLCRTLAPSEKRQGQKLLDYTTGNTNKYVELECVDVHGDVKTIPRSSSDTQSTVESSVGDGRTPFQLLEYDSSILELYDAVVIVESPKSIPEESEDFVLGDLELEQSTNFVLGDASLWKLFTRGYDLSLPMHRPIGVSVSIPSAWSSLLAYEFDVRFEESSTERFAPFMMQHIRDEVKWHVNLNRDGRVLSLINGVSPYCPYSKNNLPTMQLKLFSDSLASDQVLDIYMSVDWLKSLSLLILKYRLAIVSMPISICLMVLSFQWRVYMKTAVYPSFGAGLQRLCRVDIIVPIFVVASLLSSLTSFEFVQRILRALDPVDTTDFALMKRLEDPSIHTNPYFLGIDASALWFYGPMFFIISISLVCTVYLVILAGVSGFHCFNERFGSGEAVERVARPPVFNSRRRTVGMIMVFILVPFFVPFQFAYVICCIVQITVVLRASSSKTASTTPSLAPSGMSPSQVYQNFSNYSLSFLMVMIWLLPINIPILIVWFHNFSLKWSTPFSSSHNFLAIIPIVLVVQHHVSGSMIPRPKSRAFQMITRATIAYFSFYALVYGPRNLYWLHHLFNFFCAWCLLLCYDSSSISGRLVDSKEQPGEKDSINGSSKLH